MATLCGEAAEVRQIVKDQSSSWVHQKADAVFLLQHGLIEQARKPGA